jgi:hypothetical protein
MIFPDRLFERSRALSCAKTKRIKTKRIKTKRIKTKRIMSKRFMAKPVPRR